MFFRFININKWFFFYTMIMFFFLTICAYTRFSAPAGHYFSGESSWKPKRTQTATEVVAVWVRFGFQLGLRQWEALIIMHLDYGENWGAAPQIVLYNWRADPQTVPYSNCFIISASHCRRPSWKPKRTQTAAALWPFGFVLGFQLDSLEKWSA